MRFVQKWSYACAKGLSAVLNENHNRKAVYYYGFYILIGSLVKTSILLLVSALLGVLIPAFIIVIVFGTLRLFAGGYHFDTYGRCLFTSMGLNILAALISQYTHQWWNIFQLILFFTIVSLISLYALIKYAPKDTPTKPITEPEAIKKYKKLSVVCLVICMLVCIILIAFNMKMYVISICFGLLLEIFSVTPIGHSFFSLIKTGLDNTKVKNM